MMAIQREDLVAAAALGLLQYRQIDPLLVFLLQRDVQLQREAMLAQSRSTQVRRTHAMLSYLAGLLAIVTAAMFAVVFATRAVGTLNMNALVLAAALYGLCAIGLSSWFKKQGFGMTLRLVTAFTVPLVPAALFALQQAS